MNNLPFYIFTPIRKKFDSDRYGKVYREKLSNNLENFIIKINPYNQEESICKLLIKVKQYKSN